MTFYITLHPLMLAIKSPLLNYLEVRIIFILFTFTIILNRHHTFVIKHTLAEDKKIVNVNACLQSTV